MVHGQALRIKPDNPERECSPYLPPANALSSYVGLSSGSLHEYTVAQGDTDRNIYLLTLTVTMLKEKIFITYLQLTPMNV